jgi:uncharacterized protein YjeT (DUF2065 family)
METMFLATIMGWVMLVIGFLFLFKHEHIKAVMSDLIAHPGPFFVFALMTFILGLLLVVTHNHWTMGWSVVLTILGWLVLLNGLFRLLFSHTATKIGKSLLHHPVKLQFIGAVLLVVGVFLLYHVYGAYLLKMG